MPVCDILGTIERHTAERVFIDLLDASASQRRNVSDSKHAGIFAASPNAERYNQRDFARARESLFATGEIRMELYGRKSDERSRIVRVVEEASDEP